VSPVGSTELSNGGLDVLVDGSLGDTENLADLPGGIAVRHPCEDLALTRREGMPSGYRVSGDASAHPRVTRGEHGFQLLRFDRQLDAKLLKALRGGSIGAVAAKLSAAERHLAQTGHKFGRCHRHEHSRIDLTAMDVEQFPLLRDVLENDAAQSNNKPKQAVVFLPQFSHRQFGHRVSPRRDAGGGPIRTSPASLIRWWRTRGLANILAWRLRYLSHMMAS